MLKLFHVVTVATDSKDGHGLTREKYLDQLFKFQYYACKKAPKKVLLVSASLNNLFDVFFISLTEYFIYGQKH